MAAAQTQPNPSAVLAVGDRVTLHNLSRRSDLNGAEGTLARFHRDVGRWQVALVSTDTTIRARAANLQRTCSHLDDDRIEVVVESREGNGDGYKRYVVPRSQWKVPEEIATSAQIVLVNLLLAERGYQKYFDGEIVLFESDRPPRFHVPPPITVLPDSVPTPLWDPDELTNALRTALHPRNSLAIAPIDWDEPDDFKFTFPTVTRFIELAHNSDVVYLALRTDANRLRFAALQAMSTADSSVALAMDAANIMQKTNRRTVCCAPTEAIVYHRDNMVKLPSSMALEVAVRKVVDLVTHGTEVPCPLCLELPSVEQATVFLPCVCNVAIHIGCMQKLYDMNVKTCPTCRSHIDYDSFEFNGSTR